MAKKINYEQGAVAFVGCIIVGVALGMLFDNPAVGSMLGVGVGSLALAFFRSK